MATASKLYIQSLGRPDQGHYHRERERQAEDVHRHKDAMLEHIQPSTRPPRVS